MTTLTERLRRSAVLATVMVAATAALAACGRDTTRPTTACPQVMLERDTARLVVFRDGPGRDLTDVVMEAEVAGFGGDCKPGKPGEPVLLNVQPLFTVNKGPAWDGQPRTLSYFLAIPEYFPDPGAKQVYSMTVAFPSPTATRVVLRDELVSLRVPLPEGRRRAAPVFLGFQLTADQLDHNRRSR